MPAERTRPPDRGRPSALGASKRIVTQLERRDWELWAVALSSLTLFAGGLLALVYFSARHDHPLLGHAEEYLWMIMLALLAFILLINLYLIEQKRALAVAWRRSMTEFEEAEQQRAEEMHDPLTGTYSRRFVEEILPKEVSRADRTGHPLSFLFLDIDGFRQLNQWHGHLVGDEVLRAVAQVIVATVRESDFLFRYGGDEFLLALPQTPAQGATVAARRIREALARGTELSQRLGHPVAVRIGQATYRGERAWQEMVEEAERATQQPEAMA